MFKKKSCAKCGNKISSKYDFCPYCGNQLKNKRGDLGMLGKIDTINEFEGFSNSLFGGGMLGKMMGRTIKMLEKELQNEFKNQNNTPKTNFELIINGKRINPKDIKVSQPKQIIKKSRKVLPNISRESLKKISSLPKAEPLTNMRRFADKVIYEIKIPGVKSIDDVSIIQFENSIEIKALAKDKVYFKIIPLNLPVTDYNLSKGKLVLELIDSQNL